MRAVFFDLDGTLYDREEAFAQTFEAFFGPAEHALIHRAALCCDKRSEFSLAEATRGSMSAREMHIYRFKNGLRDAGIEIGDEEALEYQRRYAAYQQAQRLSPRVVEMLEHCRARFDRVGLMTNGMAAHQRKKIERMGIDRLLDPELILVSGEIGAVKPDARIFRHAARIAGAEPNELIMVGDSYETDIAGALREGWHTVHFNREREPVPEGKPLPDMSVYSEEELVERMREIADEEL